MDRSALLEQAYELAFFLHHDEEIALRIVVEAGAKLDVATIAQRKRLYYKPIMVAPSRIARPRFRHRILLSDLHLFQRLIYIESEPHEKRKEQRLTPPPNEAELIIHFIKHLIRIALKRNSFYVNVGISRVLYNYRTSDAVEIYNVVVQDPDRVKDDYYYRSRKAVLMSELKDRFGELLRTCRGPHGEERFQESDCSTAHSELVNECLFFFTPWATSCLVPAGFDPIDCEIPAFVTRSSTQNDSAEVNRVHALIHPQCFRRLVDALGLDCPDKVLSIPHFFLKEANDGQGPPVSRRPTPSWDTEKFNAIETELAAQAARRRKCSPQLVRVIVDGFEAASLNLEHEQMLQLEIANHAELIELRTMDAQGELVLVAHLIKRNEALETIEPLDYRLALQRNQVLTIGLSNLSADADHSMLTVSYRKNARAFLPAHLLRLWNPPLLTGWPQVARRLATGLLAVLALALFLVLLRGVGSSLFDRSQEQVSLQAKNEPQRAAASGDHEKPGNGNTGDGPAPTKPTPLRQGSKQPPSEARPSALEQTRTTTPRDNGKSLLEVKKIFVEALGDRSTAQPVVDALQERLRTLQRFALAETLDQADAVLKVTARQESSGDGHASDRRSVMAQLVNANGDVLWAQRHNQRSAPYSGSPDRIATTILKDLLAVVRQNERKPD